MILLQGLDGVTGFFQGGDAQGGGARAAQGGHDGGVGVDGGGADSDLVGARGLAGGRVDHQLNLLVFEEIDGVGAALGKLEDPADAEAGLFQDGGGAAGGHDFKTQRGQLAGDGYGLSFVGVGDADEHAAAEG